MKLLSYFITVIMLILNSINLTYAETTGMGDSVADMMLDMMDGVGFIDKSNYINSRANEDREIPDNYMNYQEFLKFNEWQNYMNLMGMPMQGLPMQGMGMSALSQAQKRLLQNQLMKKFDPKSWQQEKKSTKDDFDPYALAGRYRTDDYREFLHWKAMRDRNLSQPYLNNQAIPIAKSDLQKKKTPIDGRWLNQTGNTLAVGYGRFKIHQTDGKVYRGDIRTKGHNLSLRAEATGKVSNFEFAIKDNKLALRSETGKLLLFRRQQN